MADDADDLGAEAEKQEKSLDIALLEQQMAMEESKTRRGLARGFIRWYLIILAGILLLVPLYNLYAHQITSDHEPLLLNMIDVLQVYSSVVGPLAGFVIAYYFKSK